MFVGIVQFPCGVISYPGTYQVKLHNSSGRVVSAGTPSQFNAVWAKFRLTIPSTHIAQESADVILRSAYIDNRIACNPEKMADSFLFEVWMYFALLNTCTIIVRNISKFSKKIEIYLFAFWNAKSKLDSSVSLEKI